MDNRGRNNNNDRRNNSNYRTRRTRRSKHQPPDFTDQSACKYCHSKSLELMNNNKKGLSSKEIKKALLPKRVDNDGLDALEMFGERWEVTELFQYLDFLISLIFQNIIIIKSHEHILKKVT
eukprot:UN26741